MDNLREDLDHLVHSPGWRRFTAYVEQEWGTREHGGGARYEQESKKCMDITDDSVAIGQLRQVMAARREIHNLLAWVQHELKQATKDDRELVAAGQPDYSRRGSL